MSEEADKINEYVCQKCKGVTRTVNRDSGTTPFMIQCKVANVGCGGMAQSSFYRVSQNKLPGWEWIRPTPEEFEAWITSHKAEDHRETIKEHCDNGGMLMRKIDVHDLRKYGFRLRHG